MVKVEVWDVVDRALGAVAGVASQHIHTSAESAMAGGGKAVPTAAGECDYLFLYMYFGVASSYVLFKICPYRSEVQTASIYL